MYMACTGQVRILLKIIVCGGFDLSKDGYYGNEVYFYEDNSKGRLYACNWAGKKYDAVSIVKANFIVMNHFTLI